MSVKWDRAITLYGSTFHTGEGDDSERVYVPKAEAEHRIEDAELLIRGQREALDACSTRLQRAEHRIQQLEGERDAARRAVETGLEGFMLQTGELANSVARAEALEKALRGLVESVIEMPPPRGGPALSEERLTKAVARALAEGERT